VTRRIEIAVDDPGSADAQWCVQQYFAELNARFPAGFNPSLSISADRDELSPPAGLFLLARIDGRPIGCGALKFHPGAPAELKRMWVVPGARGIGLGRQILAELEEHARAAGAQVLHLETNETLVEAIGLYRRSGFSEVPAFNDEPYAQHWFEKRLA
jgi:GNAT superfamily N-acetyltransferase